MSRYEEALERAKEEIKKYPKTLHIYAKAFPELAESTDDKMWKEIIETLQHVKDNRNGIIKAHYTDEKIDAMISYIEKQKELQQVAWDEEDEKMRWNLIHAFTDKNNSAVDEFVGLRARKCEVIAWLKSLCRWSR